MKGFTKRFLAVMIAVSVLSQAGIAAFAADTGLSYKGMDTVSDLSAGTKLQERKAAPEDVVKGSQANAYMPKIVIEGESEDDFALVTIEQNNNNDFEVRQYGALVLSSPDDETEVQLSGNIEIFDMGIVDVGEYCSTTGTITVHAGGTLAIAGTVDHIVIEEDAVVMLGDGELLNMPEGYTWSEKDEYDVRYLVPLQNAGENYAARIEDTHYPTIEEALDAAESGQTVVLLDDIASDSSITVEAGITLDLNGHDLSVGQTLAVTGKLVDSGESRGHFAAGTYFFAKNTGSAFPVYDSDSGAYSLYDLTVTTYNDAQLGDAGKYGFRLKKGSERDAATALMLNDQNAGLVEARVLIAWKETQDGQEMNVEKTIAYSRSDLLMHAGDPGHIILTFRMTGIDNVSGPVTATPVFVTKDSENNVIAEIKGDTLTVKE